MRELGEIVRVKTAEGEALGIVVSQEEGDGYGIHLFEPNHYASDGTHFGGILGKSKRKNAESKTASDKDDHAEPDWDSLTHTELDKIAKGRKAQNYPQKGDKAAKVASLRGTS